MSKQEVRARGLFVYSTANTSTSSTTKWMFFSPLTAHQAPSRCKPRPSSVAGLYDAGKQPWLCEPVSFVQRNHKSGPSPNSGLPSNTTAQAQIKVRPQFERGESSERTKRKRTTDPTHSCRCGRRHVCLNEHNDNTCHDHTVIAICRYVSKLFFLATNTRTA